MFDDVATGSGRPKRVRRTASARASIVAESYEAGATVAGIARRHGVVPSQLSGWRSAARRREKSGAVGTATFAEVTVAPDLVPVGTQTHDGVEIIVGGVTVRLPQSVAAKRIVEIAHRLASGA